jgi:transcriptional regulator with XRE-family HTH domain
MSRTNLKVVDPVPGTEEAVGLKLRYLRKDRGISLQALSEGTGLSIGLISQIERGLSSPSVKSLVALAEVLDVRISWFFDDVIDIDDGQEKLVVRREARRRISMNVDGIRKELLSPDQDRSLQLFAITIEAGGGSGPEPYSHGGEVAACVLSGSLLLWVDKRRFILRSGDSFCIPKNMPRRYENPDQTQESKLLWAISYPETSKATRKAGKAAKRSAKAKT